MVAGPPRVRASLVKNASWAPRPGLLVVDQGVLPAGAELGIDRPRLASSLLQRKHEGTAVWRLPLCSLGVWEPSLGMGPQGPFSLQNDLPASTSQPGLTVSPQAAGDAISLGGRRAAPESGFPGLCHAASQCVAPQTPDLWAISQGLNSQVRAGCLPALCEPCKHIPRSEKSCQWGRRLWECI